MGFFSHVLTLDPLERPNPTPNVGVQIQGGGEGGGTPEWSSFGSSQRANITQDSIPFFL
jgi:hypothetical protein